MTMHTIDDFRALLPIDKHRLDDELETHAQTQDRIASKVAALNSAQLELKRQVEIEEARLVAQLKTDDPKMTNPMAEKEAKRQRSYTSMWNAYQDARREYEEWQGLLAAWVSRGYNLKTLGDLYGNQYFAVDSVSRKSDPSADRQRLRDASRSRDETPVMRRRA